MLLGFILELLNCLLKQISVRNIITEHLIGLLFNSFQRLIWRYKCNNDILGPSVEMYLCLKNVLFRRNGHLMIVRETVLIQEGRDELTRVSCGLFI